MSPTVSSEFERICDCGRSARAAIFGARGSLTSTAVKFFGALSWASQRMRRPSLASCIDMPSPIPPKPSSVLCPSGLKFQISVSLEGVVALWDIGASIGGGGLATTIQAARAQSLPARLGGARRQSPARTPSDCGRHERGIAERAAIPACADPKRDADGYGHDGAQHAGGTIYAPK